MHQRSRGADLVLADPSVGFRHVTHGLEQRADEIFGQRRPPADARKVARLARESLRKSTIELVTEQ